MAMATGSFARYHPPRSFASGTRACAKLDGVPSRAALRVHPGPLRTSRDAIARRGSAAREDASTWKPSSDADTERMVFLGDDRAALTAAIYAARAGLEPLVFETMEGGGDETWDGEEASSDATGRMRAQATKSGAAFHPRDDPVTNVDLSKNPFAIETMRGVVVYARTLVVSETIRGVYAALELEVEKNETTETTTTPGAFVARGSGFAAGVAAERWHGPVERPRDSTTEPLSRPNSAMTKAFGETANKVRAALRPDEKKTRSPSPFAQAERLSDVLPGANDVASGRKRKTSEVSDVFPFDPLSVRHRGADAFRRLYAGDGFFGDSPRETKALVAFFGAEGCAPCARVRPMLASVVDEYDRDRVRFVEMDVEADADMADALGVAGTPFALFYRVEARSEKTDAVAVERVAAVVGGKTKRAYRDALDAILGEDARVDGPRRRFS
jgi:thiol-disulfide isomerase/thioredoxin